MNLPVFPFMLRSTHNRRVGELLDESQVLRVRVKELEAENNRLIAQNAKRGSLDEKLAVVAKQIRKDRGKKK